MMDYNSTRNNSFRLLPSGGGSNRRPENPCGGARGDVCGSLSPLVVGESNFVCQCGRSFGTRIGLGQHRRHAHPAEVNLARAQQVGSRRGPWSVRDDEALVRLANTHYVSGMLRKDLCLILATFFEGRSVEAIRKRLQHVRWSPPGSAVRGSPMEDPESTASDGQKDLWIERMIQAINDVGADGSTVDGLRCVLRDLVNQWHDGSLPLETARTMLEDLIAETFPHVWRPSVQLRRGVCPKTKRGIRRAQYAQVQKLYVTRRKDCAAAVLSGDWRVAHHGNSTQPVDLLAFWKGMFSQSGHPDLRPVRQPSQCHWSVLDPITPDEVVQAVKDMRSTAPGLDRLTVADVQRLGTMTVIQLLNVLLVLRTPTSHLSKARVTLIPKFNDAKNPGDFRPIAVTSVLLRLLHKILARRWRGLLPLSPWQLAFLQRDGCSEASAALNAIIRAAHQTCSSLASVFVDVSKAYDMVSHDTVLRVARQVGLPGPMVEYLEGLYGNSTVLIGEDTVKCHRGVRQGDPLSPLLFIAVMDEVIAGSLPGLGVTVNGQDVDHLAYADDLVIFAENADRLKERLAALSDALAAAGMEINSRKSVGMTLRKDGKNKRLILWPTAYEVRGTTIRPLMVDDAVKYLGLRFGWKGRLPVKSTSTLETMLVNIMKAPLKPQQRMDILVRFALPRLYHELSLGMAHRNTLKRMDTMVRKFVRAWLHLPKDTSLGFFYAKRINGGLGIPSLATTVPMIQRGRMERLARSSLAPAQLVSADPSFLRVLRQINVPIRVGATVVTNPKEATSAWSRMFTASCDGRGIRGFPADSSSLVWSARPELLPPRLYLRSTWLRGGVLSTKVRRNRGREVPVSELACRGGCGAVESDDHILQSCAVTHEVRCERHNRIMRWLASRVSKRGLETMVEPIVPVERTFRKPDLVVVKDDNIYIMDVCVVAGQSAQHSWQAKINKYATPEIENAVRALVGKPLARVTHLPILISNRGLLYARSGSGLRSLGLGRSVLTRACQHTVCGSLKCYDVYMRGLR